MTQEQIKKNIQAAEWRIEDIRANLAEEAEKIATAKDGETIVYIAGTIARLANELTKQQTIKAMLEELQEKTEN